METYETFRWCEQMRYDFFVLTEGAITQADLKLMDQIENRIVNEIARLSEIPSGLHKERVLRSYV